SMYPVPAGASAGRKEACIPPPRSTQKTRGWARVLPQRLRCRRKRVISRHHKVSTASAAQRRAPDFLSSRLAMAPTLPKTMAGQFNKHVFQGRLAKGDRLNGGGKGFHHIAHERMAMRHLDTHPAIDNDRLTAKTLAYLSLQSHRVRRLHYHHVPANTLPQFIRRPDSHEVSLMQDSDTITVFSFLQDVGGQQDTHPFLVTQMLQIGHEIEAGTRIEARARLIEQEHGWGVQERFGKL